MIYPSKIDWWLGAILALAGLGLIGAGIAAFVLPLAQPVVLGLGAILGMIPLGLGLLVLWQLVATRYEITDTDLILRSGPFRWTIALDQIIEVYPTRKPPPNAPGFTLADHFRGNHPALSLDRLRVNYQRERGVAFYLISPLDQAGFLDELARALPSLHRSQRRIHRGPPSGLME